MASIARDPKGKKRILFMNGDGQRKTIRLGKTSLKQAEAFKIKLEALIAARFSGSMDPQTARWTADLPDDIHGKLANAGLLTARSATSSQSRLSLGQFLNEYCTSRIDVKPNTQLVYRRAVKHLIQFFGADKLITDITKGDAKRWQLSLIEQGLAKNTVRRQCGVARQFFNAALDDELISKNPFTWLIEANTLNFFFLYPMLPMYFWVLNEPYCRIAFASIPSCSCFRVMMLMTPPKAFVP